MVQFFHFSGSCHKEEEYQLRTESLALLQRCNYTKLKHGKFSLPAI